MGLMQLEVTNFRSFEQVKLLPSRGLNVIAGANASGKTSLLEAVHTLGMGRSFRSGGSLQMVRYGTDGLIVHGRYRMESGIDVVLGVERTLSGRRIKVNGKPCDGARMLAEILPLQAIVSDTRYLFIHNAQSRRAIMDWGLFHVEPQFYPLWLRYQRALRQRNSALSDGVRVLETWDHELASLGEQVHILRQRYVDSLQPQVVAQASVLLAEEGLELELRPGWASGQPLAHALIKSRERDRAHGYTHAGAHRADLEIRLNGLPLKEGASQGQQKLAIIALRLAQVELVRQQCGRQCLLLLDDVSGELDQEHQARLMAVAAALDTQAFVTVMEPAELDTDAWQDCKVFHVEHGQVREG
ncbi:MAG: DNA replication/repair protein RecF [Gammaproteobacteria bacterium]|nr:DNA replication/repair protein RecF [Gammaproteobacteria bacterium]